MDLAALGRLTVVGVTVAWIAFGAVLLLWRRRSGSAAATRRARDPMGLVGLVLQGAGFFLAWSERRAPGTPLLDGPAPVAIALSVLAVGVAAGSVALATWAVRTLGPQWALDARLIEGHALVTTGPYRFVRNPIYTGMLGMALATGLAVAHPAGLALAVAVYLSGTVVRVRAEERLLRGAFGEAWSAWASRTAALVPGIW
jgi:protein-S-isoprenylcysteine O-methyltransferase Ste14